MKNFSNLSGLSQKLKLVAVTKGHSMNEIEEMLSKIPVTAIAENRLAEAQEKFKKMPPNLEKHFIGKLQSRKIPELVALFDVIQTVENLKQAKAISRQEKEISVFIQVNISGIFGRSGVSPKEAGALIEEVQKLPNLNLKGVMGMASQDPSKVREEFRLLKSLQGNLAECSMGMSDDYQIAIEEGATTLRIGRLLFQE